MKITCPHCLFQKDIPDDRLPGKTAIATCPRCRHRFRIARDDAPQHAPEDAPAPSAASAEDDPLPPGAIIPGTTPRESSPLPRDAAETVQPRDEEEPPRAAPRDDDPEIREHQDSGETERFALDNPWDQPQRDGYIAAFYQTTMRVMFAASRFFAGLRPDVPQWRPLLFYIIISLMQILVERFWAGALLSALSPGVVGDPQLHQVIQMLTPQTSLPMAVLLRVAFAALELFLAAGLYHVAFRLVAPDRANYSLIFQVLAYSAAPALLCVVPVVGSLAGFVWGTACGVIGCRYALRLSWGQVMASLLPLYLLLALFLLFLGQVMARL